MLEVKLYYFKIIYLNLLTYLLYRHMCIKRIQNINKTYKFTNY